MVRASVEVAKGKVDLHFHIGTATLAGVEVSATAEEATEQIERIVHASSASLRSLFMLLHAFVSILIVDSSYLCVGEDIVRFGDFDESLVRRVIVGVLVGVVLFRESAVGLFDLAIVGVFFEAEKLGGRISVCGAGMSDQDADPHTL